MDSGGGPRTLLAAPFRLFFLLAALLAAVWMPAWLFVLTEGVRLSTDLGGVGWHAHEMVFGYMGAAVAGFLLTATQVWTARQTVGRNALLALAGLWVVGRAVALHTASLPWWLAPAVDGAFWWGSALAIGRPIILARSTRNLVFPLLLVLLGASDIVVHLHVSHRISPVWSARSLQVALDALALMILVFGGRIIPLFTANAVPQLDTRPKGLLDGLGLAAMTVLLGVHAVSDPSRWSDGLAMVTGTLNAARLWGWGGTRTLRRPILWVLHAGWLLLCAAILSYVAAGFVQSIPGSAVLHLFTVGGLGVITMGMMARVSLGHTGRALVVPASVAAAFILVIAAALTRTLIPVVHPPSSLLAAQLSGAAWAVAFALFSMHYVPIWLAPRADGKPG